MANFKRLIPFMFVFCLLGSIQACTNPIEPPRSLGEPVTVHLIDHGRHASLVLSDNKGNLVRFTYGDWRWYALSDEGVWQGAAALLWPTQGTLGRRTLNYNVHSSPDHLLFVEGSEEQLKIKVETRDMMDLYSELQAAFERQESTQIYNQRYDLDFVHYHERYSVLNNSNSMVKRWLERLGCEVNGNGFSSQWELL